MASVFYENFWPTDSYEATDTLSFGPLDQMTQSAVTIPSFTFSLPIESFSDWTPPPTFSLLSSPPSSPISCGALETQSFSGQNETQVFTTLQAPIETIDQIEQNKQNEQSERRRSRRLGSLMRISNDIDKPCDQIDQCERQQPTIPIYKHCRKLWPEEWITAKGHTAGFYRTERMLEEYPELIYIVYDDERREFVLEYHRRNLMEAIDADHPDWNLTVHERALKHAGLQLVKKSNFDHPSKVWRLRYPHPSQILRQKRKRKMEKKREKYTQFH